MPDRAAADEEIRAGIRRQVEIALSDAAFVALVTDVTAGRAPLDAEVAAMVRRSGRPAAVAANKADNESRDAAAAEFAEFGFPVFPVSALHGRGLAALMRHVLRHLPPAPAPEAARAQRVAVVGRPNVGKSSYINHLLCEERLLVSSLPGTTRDSVDVPLRVGEGSQARRLVLTDTAGMRYASKAKSAVDKFSLLRARESIERADVAVLMLDAVTGPTALDRKIASLILRARKGCVLVVNKWDLAKGAQRAAYESALRGALPFLAHCPIVFVSAKTGQNVFASLEAVDHVAGQLRAALPTSLLNRVVLEATRRVHPPAVQGRALKIFYAAQVGHSPVRVRLFVNDPRLVRPAYSDYLVRSLRERFGLAGAPVLLEFRGRRRVR
jgi:GTP-binding protein